MEAVSNLRKQLPTAAQVSAAYGVHRPLVQRIIKTSFVLYVIGTSYNAFIRPSNASGGSPSRRSRKAKQDGKPERVEVRPNFLRLTGSLCSDTYLIGRCSILRKAIKATKDCHTEFALKRSSAPGDAFGLLGVPHRLVALCCRPRWQVQAMMKVVRPALGKVVE